MDDLLDPGKKHELYISIGSNFLYHINLNQLRPKPKSEKKSEEEDKLGPPMSIKEIEEAELADLAKLEEKYRKETELALVFSRSTHKQSNESDYPIGMGMFVHDSIFHFFGGQNLENNRPILPCESNPNLEDWYNKKVFSFTPNFIQRSKQHTSPYTLRVPLYDRYSKPRDSTFTPNLNKYDDSIQHSKASPRTYTTPVLNPKLHITRLKESTSIPNHIGYKARPIVFTILGKIYAFATKPILTTLSFAKIFDPIYLFEVFDPKLNEWSLLPNPPNLLYDKLVCDYFPELGYCVFDNKLLLQTDFGQFVFDAKKNAWDPETYPYPRKQDLFYAEILASLEYKGHLLLFLEHRDSYYLVSYDLASFVNFPINFNLREAGYTFILSVDDIDKYYKNHYLPVMQASLCLVDNNHICLAFNRSRMLHVCLLEVNTGAATVKAHQKFSLPSEVNQNPNIMSTFIIENDPNQGFSRGELNSVFVSNLPCTITTFDILHEFQLLKFGEIKSDGVFLNCKEDYAFVEFVDVLSRDKAIKASPINFSGKEVSIEPVSCMNLSQSHLLWWRWRKEKKESKQKKAGIQRSENII